ncbi:MAG: S1 family peptidase [Kofleriaceae bacterium]
MKKLFVLSLGLSALIGCANDSSSASSDDSDDQDSADVDADGAVDSLASDRGISPAEAAVRMSWQDKLDDLEDQLSDQLGAAYGGLWIDPDHGDRIQVALSDMTASPVAMSIAQQLGVDAGTDLVQVKRSQAELQQIVDEVAAADADTIAGVDPTTNKVVLSTATGQLSPAAQTVANKYGDAIAVEAAESAVAQANSFNPPARGGIRIDAPISGGEALCTLGFIGHDAATATHPYILFAGHCVQEAGGEWFGHYANGSSHVIGNGGVFEVDAGGDFSALRLSDAGSWHPRPWIVVQKGPSSSYIPRYTIKANSGSRAGTRVCHTGITSGTHCGTIKKVEQTITYDGVHAIGHMVKTNYCGKPGDSGGPVFASHKAFGIHDAGAADGSCISYYMPIGRVESSTKTRVVHCKGAGATVSSADACCSLDADHSRSNTTLTCN